MNIALEKVQNAADSQQDFNQIPRNIPDGYTTWDTDPYHTWTAGFWPGVLWYLYDYTGDESWKNLAHERNLPVAQILTGDKKDHDLGFQFFCSFGNGYRLTGNEQYKEYVLTAADQLADMYHPTVGTILSWPHAIDRYKAPHNTILGCQKRW
jgi:unsaturated chondroitin disaccharide hydrolase